MSTERVIPYSRFNINGKPIDVSVDNKFYIYNLGPAPMVKVGMHIEPVNFARGDTTSYTDDWKNSRLWIMTPYSDGTAKVLIKIDDTDSYEVKYGTDGSGFETPIVFKRTATNKSTKVNFTCTDYSIDFYPLYGNDNTEYGKDWLERINNNYHNPDRDSSEFLNSDGFNNDSYLGDHIYNSQYGKLKNEDDKMSVQILAVDHAEYDEIKMVEACNNILLSIYYPQKNDMPYDLTFLQQRDYDMDKYYFSGN